MSLFEVFMDEMQKTAGDVIPFSKKMSPEEIRANFENAMKELSDIKASNDAQKARLEQAAKGFAGHREKIEDIKSGKIPVSSPKKFPRWAKAGVGGAAGLTALVGGGLLLSKLLKKKKEAK